MTGLLAKVFSPYAQSIVADQEVVSGTAIEAGQAACNYPCTGKINPKPVYLSFSKHLKWYLLACRVK